MRRGKWDENKEGRGEWQWEEERREEIITGKKIRQEKWRKQKRFDKKEWKKLSAENRLENDENKENK